MNLHIIILKPFSDVFPFCGYNSIPFLLQMTKSLLFRWAPIWLQAFTEWNSVTWYIK